MRGMRGPHSKIATHGARGGIYISSRVPESWRGIDVKARLRRHERVEYHLMQQGLSYKEAHKKALKQEHKGLTKKQVQAYEGKIGSLART